MLKNYVIKKEKEDKKDEDARKRKLKDKEMATKKYLDLQMQEKNEKVRLVKYEEGFEANQIKGDVNKYQMGEKEKSQAVQKKFQEHKQGLKLQMEDKKKVPQMEEREYQINKELINRIKEEKKK